MLYLQEVLSLCNTYEQFSVCNTYMYEQFFLCVTHMSGSFIVRYIRAVFLQTYRRFVKHVTSFHLPLSVYISTHSSWEELIASDGSPLFQFRKFTGEPSRQENPSDKTNIKILSMGYSKGSVLDSSLKLISLSKLNLINVWQVFPCRCEFCLHYDSKISTFNFEGIFFIIWNTVIFFAI